MKANKIFKKGQEEMVGFALIVIIVAVIILIFLAFYLTKEKKPLESNQVGNFLQASMEYTSNCRDNLGYKQIKELILDCERERVCLDERNTCEVLENTLKEMTKTSWDVSPERPVKGYEMNITIADETIIYIKEGNKTNIYEGSREIFPHDIEVLFNVYI